jgi:hypothetical protein
MISKQDEPQFKETKISKPKRGIRIFDQHDSSLRVLACLGYRHRVGLLAFSLVGYVALDHISGLSTFGQIIYGTIFGS